MITNFFVNLIVKSFLEIPFITNPPFLNTFRLLERITDNKSRLNLLMIYSNYVILFVVVMDLALL